MGNGGMYLPADRVAERTRRSAASVKVNSLAVIGNSSVQLIVAQKRQREFCELNVKLAAVSGARNGSSQRGLLKNAVLNGVHTTSVTPRGGDLGHLIRDGKAGLSTTSMATSCNMSPRCRLENEWCSSIGSSWSKSSGENFSQEKTSTTRTEFAAITGRKILNSGVKNSRPANVHQSNSIARPALASSADSSGVFTLA